MLSTQFKKNQRKSTKGHLLPQREKLTSSPQEDAKFARGRTTTPKIATQRKPAPFARRLDIRQTDATSKTKTKEALQRRTKVKLTSLKNPMMRLILFMSLMMTFCKSFKSLLKRTLCTQRSTNLLKVPNHLLHKREPNLSGSKITYCTLVQGEANL